MEKSEYVQVGENEVKRSELEELLADYDDIIADPENTPEMCVFFKKVKSRLTELLQ